MAAKPKIIDHGTLHASSDTWLLAREHVQPLEFTFDVDPSLEGKMVSVLGKLRKPRGKGEAKLVVEKLALHDDIAARAEAIHQSGQGGSAEENWLRAERELLGV